MGKVERLVETRRNDSIDLNADESALEPSPG